MNLIPWRKRHGQAYPLDPFRRQMDRLFEDFFGGWPLAGRASESAFVPRLDVAEDEGQVVVSAELPGMSEKDLEVSLADGVLTISGEKKDGREAKDKSYHLVERSYGRFSRSVELGRAVDEGKVAAAYKDGILRVTVPKSEKAKPRKISIHSG